jgi:hypothetical protein
VTSPTMIRVRAVVAPAVWRMMPPRPTPVISMRLAPQGAEDDGPRHARMAERYLEVLAGKDLPAEREPGDLGQW